MQSNILATFCDKALLKSYDNEVAYFDVLVDKVGAIFEESNYGS